MGASARDVLPGADRLNEAERAVLRLLAQGHTAKSIAATLGASVGAVNERLREARRKTGIGSSRELARLLRAQENRDEEIGVAGAAPLRPSPEGEVPPRVACARKKGFVVMSIVALAAASAVLILSQAPSPTAAPNGGGAGSATLQRDELLKDMLAMPSVDPRQLHQDLRREARDEAWASAMEEALERRYSAVPLVADLRILCGSSLCEIAGRFTAAGAAVDRSVQALQSDPLSKQVAALGLEHRLAGFSGNTFAIYWTRNPQPPAGR